MSKKYVIPKRRAVCCGLLVTGLLLTHVVQGAEESIVQGASDNGQVETGASDGNIASPVKSGNDVSANRPDPKSVPMEVPLDLVAGTSLEKDQLVRLSQRDAVWLDKQSKLVIIAGSICHREGPLEMFACPRGTKEYESVVAVDSRAQIVHAALLAAGVKPGTPVVFAPEYKPATGTVIEITAVWTDDATKKQHRTLAQNWVRHVATGKPMSTEWVFAGSSFWKDPDTGKEIYLAEGGELVCVSNFSTATLDLPVASPQGNDDLYFDAFTEQIPPVGTQVWLVLRAKNPSDAPEK